MKRHQLDTMNTRVVPTEPTEEDTAHECKLDKSACEHEFTETGNPDEDYCTKCGQSVWAWAMMEMP